MGEGAVRRVVLLASLGFTLVATLASVALLLGIGASPGAPAQDGSDGVTQTTVMSPSPVVGGSAVTASPGPEIQTTSPTVEAAPSSAETPGSTPSRDPVWRTLLGVVALASLAASILVAVSLRASPVAQSPAAAGLSASDPEDPQLSADPPRSVPSGQSPPTADGLTSADGPPPVLQVGTPATADSYDSPRSVENPLENRAWLRVVEEMVMLFEEVERIGTSLSASERTIAEHTQLRLQEILERAGVGLIAEDTAFDRTRHQPEPRGAQVARGAAIARTLSPGFVVGPRVLRRARVQVEDQSLATRGQSP